MQKLLTVKWKLAQNTQCMPYKTGKYPKNLSVYAGLYTKKLSSLEKIVGKYASSIECTWVLVTVSTKKKGGKYVHTWSGLNLPLTTVILEVTGHVEGDVAETQRAPRMKRNF